MKTYSFFLLLLGCCFSFAPAQVTIYLHRGRPIEADSLYRIKAGYVTYAADYSLHDIAASKVVRIETAQEIISIQPDGTPVYIAYPRTQQVAETKPAPPVPQEPESKPSPPTAAPDTLPVVTQLSRPTAVQPAQEAWGIASQGPLHIDEMTAFQAFQKPGTPFSFERVRLTIAKLPPGYDLGSWQSLTNGERRDAMRFFTQTYYGEVSLLSGTSLKGQLLEIGDSSLWLYLSPRPYEPDDPVAQLLVEVPFVLVRTFYIIQEGNMGPRRRFGTPLEAKRYFSNYGNSPALRAYRDQILAHYRSLQPTAVE